MEIPIKLGIEVFFEKYLNLLKGKKVGLITNPTGVDSNLESTIGLFFKSVKTDLVALFAPEHGIKGDHQAGEHIPFYVDQHYNLPVFSLYDQSIKTNLALLDLDARMRSFDTLESGKSLKEDILRTMDAIVLDLQDIGCRTYTYVATMAYCIKTCARSNLEFIVLDRPNPINGQIMEGPVLDYPTYSSFIGIYPIPIRHSMTIGELAMLFNERFQNEQDKKVNLSVIPMEGWKRSMWFDDTRLPWVMTSPNMPTIESTTVYPGQVLLEGTNVSEGRGTTRPFEIFGAPWIDSYKLSRRLNKLKMAGIRFKEMYFRPTFSKYTGELCHGAQIYVLDRDKYKPFETTLTIIETLLDMYPANFEFFGEYFDKVIGNGQLRSHLENGNNIDSIRNSYQKELDNFSLLKEEFMLYE